MTSYEFTCPGCGQRIEVNEPVHDAILGSGCPVCSTSVEAEDFAVV